jgi:hypothetical protein
VGRIVPAPRALHLLHLGSDMGMNQLQKEKNFKKQAFFC